MSINAVTTCGSRFTKGNLNGFAIGASPSTVNGVTTVGLQTSSTTGNTRMSQVSRRRHSLVAAMHFTIREQSEHVGDADGGQQGDPLQHEVQQCDRGRGCVGGGLSSSTGRTTSRAGMSDPMASQRASGCHGTRIKMTAVTATDAP